MPRLRGGLFKRGGSDNLLAVSGWLARPSNGSALLPSMRGPLNDLYLPAHPLAPTRQAVPRGTSLLRWGARLQWDSEDKMACGPLDGSGVFSTLSGA